MPDCGQQEHSTDKGKEGHTEICEQISGSVTEQYGGQTQRSPGSISLPRRRQNIRLSSHGDVAGHTTEPIVRQNGKRLQSRRCRNPEDNNGKGPSDSCANPTRVFTKHGSRDNASNEQSLDDERISRKSNWK